jgi:hypothetical protein
VSSGVRKVPRNWEFQSLHVGVNWADGLPNWKVMRRKTIRFTREGLGCIRMSIREVKTEIPA